MKLKREDSNYHVHPMSKDTYSPITMYYPLRLPFYCIGFITVNSSATFQLCAYNVASHRPPG
nr:MAG TPA_asm: hypothetical protein [Caudoviricetes sp.]DAM76087.1 MAG TPA: hypothetical protein [Caudoviricetes sp.]